MRTLIVYGTKYGCTESCARQVAEQMGGEVELCNLRQNKSPDLTPYEKVIIGGPIRMGRMRGDITRFCRNHLKTLLTKKTGLFICCMAEGQQAEAELNTAFPPELLSAAAAKGYFGGAFPVSKMGFFDRMIVKKAAKVEQDRTGILADHVAGFAEAMKQA